MDVEDILRVLYLAHTYFFLSYVFSVSSEASMMSSVKWTECARLSFPNCKMSYGQMLLFSSWETVDQREPPSLLFALLFYRFAIAKDVGVSPLECGCPAVAEAGWVPEGRVRQTDKTTGLSSRKIFNICYVSHFASGDPMAPSTSVDISALPFPRCGWLWSQVRESEGIVM